MEGRQTATYSVKDLALKQCHSLHSAPLFHETPIKTSQVPNKLPHQPPRRMLPLQSPDLCSRDRPRPVQHSQGHQGPTHSTGLVPSNPVNFGSSGNRLHSVPRDRLSPPHRPAQPPGSSCSRLSPTNSGTIADRQPTSHSNITFSAFPQFRNHSPSSHIGRDQVTQSKDMQQKRTPPSEKLTPAGLNCSPVKRCREFKDSDDGATKECLHGEHFGKAQNPKATFGNSLSTSLVSTPSLGHSPVLELSPKTTDSPLCKASACGQSTDLERSSTLKPIQTHCSMGVKHVFIKSSQNNTLRLMETQSTPIKTNPGSLSRATVERHRIAHRRRSSAIPDGIDELFTPDPMTYVISPPHKTAKLMIDERTVRSSTSEKSCTSPTVPGSTRFSCSKTQNFTAGASEDTTCSTPAASLPHIFLPTVPLVRLKLGNVSLFHKDDRPPQVTLLDRLLKDASCKSNEKQTSLLPESEITCTLETEQRSTSQYSPSPPLESQPSEGERESVNEEDPEDMELDIGLSVALDFDQTQSSSEEEPLLSFQEMMERSTKPPDTPEKGAFSEPSTPGHHSCHSKTQPLPPTSEPGNYKNNLDQMLEEINTNKRAKEIETQLITACKEDLLTIAEYEEAEVNQERFISNEQKILQRFSLSSSAMRDVPPGEEVFNLEKFGQIFNHDTLQLRQCTVSPRTAAEKILWSSPAQLKLHLHIGLFQKAYNSHSPCPNQVTRFLFKMMSVHNERLVAEKIQGALCTIACTAAHQMANNNWNFQVWVPSLADVALVLINMGVAFVTLFPLENLQPPFTERDLLEDTYIINDSLYGEHSPFPEHNYDNILKYLSFCMTICPLAYSDDELLLLLSVLEKLSLDTRIVIQSNVELYPLLHKIVNNIRDWNTMLPRACLALTDLTADHHNMCLIVQLLPDNTRGKQLRQHLSLSMISKLLDENCTYRPTENEFQLSDLKPYLPRMKPSTLLQGLRRSSSRRRQDKEDTPTLDQQSYYLCNSLLTLVNEATNFQRFPADQKEQLMSLCSELVTQIKCNIRESEKCLYRSRVKDLVARIETKWQLLRLRTRPLNGKLYDWMTCSQDVQVINSCDGGEGPVPEEDDVDEEEGEISATEENEDGIIVSDEEKEEGDDTMETGDDNGPEGMKKDDTTNDMNETQLHRLMHRETPDGVLDGQM